MLSSSPAIDQLLEKMSAELGTEAVLYIHMSGQILSRSGRLPEHEYPTVAALLAGMVAAGTTLMSAAGAAAQELNKDRKRFSCEYRDRGIYSVAVGTEYWIATVYSDVMNPGHLRMKLRGYAEILEKLHIPQTLVTSSSKLAPIPGELGNNFENITDEEIERIFQY